MSNSPSRGLFPDDAEIVVLDTNVLRGIGYAQEPWIATFQEMSKAGYVFSISDLGFAEFGHQFTSGQVNLTVFNKAIELAETFVFAGAPVFPSKSDILGMIGSRSAEKAYDPLEVAEASKKAWIILKSLSTLGAADKKIQCDRFQELIEKERTSWKKWFDNYAGNPDIQSPDYLQRQFNALDTVQCDPPALSTRLDFKTRHLHRKSLHFQKSRHAYDPHSDGKKNDGPDDDLLHYLAVPAYLITVDGGLLSVAGEIKSFQSKWIMKPGEFAAAWRENRTLAPLNWPEIPPNIIHP